MERILASAVQSRWFSISLGALAVAFITTLAAATLLANSALSPDTVSLLRTTLGAALLVTLALGLIGSQIRSGETQAHAHAWELELSTHRKLIDDVCDANRCRCRLPFGPELTAEGRLYGLLGV